MAEEAQRFLEVAVSAAREAGALLRDNFGRGLQIDEETHHDIKLEMDRKAEEVILRGLRTSFPSHGFLSEESLATGGSSEYLWVIDPLDGTMNYSRAVSHFAVSVALQHSERTLVGVIYDPMKEELFSATRAGGARLNGSPIRVSGRERLEDAIAACEFTKDEERVREMLDLCSGLAIRCKKVRSMGSAALDLCYVSCGRFDIYVESGIHAWDVRAGELILEEAGGRTHWGKPVGESGLRCLATNGMLAGKALDLVRELSGGTGTENWNVPQ